MVVYNNLPLYDVFLDNEKGLEFISIVNMPAIERNFVAFAENEPIKMSMDEEQHIITGPALIPNKPIYRRNGADEYFIVFSEQSIKDVMEKYMSDKGLGINLEHTYETENASIIESYLINRDKGILHKDFDDLPDGTWIVSMKIHNEKLWELVKSNTLNGFSIEGILSLQPAKEELSKQEKSNSLINIIKKIK